MATIEVSLASSRTQAGRADRGGHDPQRQDQPQRIIQHPARQPRHRAIHRSGAGVGDGMAHLSEASGFGLEIDWNGVEKFRA